MEPCIDPNEITTDVYKVMISEALSNTSDLIEIIEDDDYAKTLIKTYGQLKEIDNHNSKELLNDLLEFNIDTGLDPDHFDKQVTRNLVGLQTSHSRRTVETHLKKIMNTWFTGIFDVTECNAYCNMSDLWYSIESADYGINDGVLEELIAFVNK